VWELVVLVDRHAHVCVHVGTLLWQAQQRAPEPIRHPVSHFPEQDSDGTLSGGGDLGPLKHPLDDGHPPTAQHQPVESQASIIPPEREAPDLGRGVSTRDAVWVPQQRLGCHGV